MASAFYLYFLVNYVLHPLVFLVMGKNDGDLYDLVKVKDEVNDHDGPVKNKCGDHTDGDNEAPHCDGVADEAEFGVSAGGEDASDKGGVNGPSENVVAAHQEHYEQVVLSSLCKMYEVQYDRS